jgi:hypothetical protein
MLEAGCHWKEICESTEVLVFDHIYPHEHFEDFEHLVLWYNKAAEG